MAGPDAEDECFLFDTPEGRKYVCTSNPAELAWHMGLEVKDLKTGGKPDDHSLIECAEDWSHNGTPQWVCKAEEQQQRVEDPEVDGCEMIGETSDEIWFACAEGAEGSEGIDCSEDTSFGVGGGPGILPQEGEVLCKQPRPKGGMSDS